MSPDVVLFGIKSLIRIGQQGNRALIEHAADKPIDIPSIKTFPFDESIDRLKDFLLLPNYRHLAKTDVYKNIWIERPPGQGGGTIDAEKWKRLSPAEQSEKFLFAVDSARNDPEGLEFLVDDANRALGNSEHGVALVSGRMLIRQWKPGDEPVSPFGRVMLTVAQIGLEYLAADPSVLGVGKSGEKVVKGFAEAVSGPLGKKLEAATLGPRAQLANDLMGALVRAGIASLRETAGELVSDKHIAKLMESALDPVLKAAEQGDALKQDMLQRVLDALAGPAAAAAMKVVAENPGAFFGARFDNARASGALVGALLAEVADNGGLRATFGDDGLVKLLSAALHSAAGKPELFLKSDNKAVAALFADVSNAMAAQVAALKDIPPADRKIDGQALAAGIAAAAIESFAKNAGAIAGDGDAWRSLAAQVSNDVLGTVAGALKSADGTALRRVFSEEKLVQLAGIVVSGIAANPATIGTGDARVREVVSLLAKAMNGKLAERKTLLSGDDWLELARTMIEELAARPAALAGNDPRLQAVVSALAEIVSGDTRALLKGGDVTAIARTMLERVVGRPALLGGLDADLKNVALAVAAAMAADDQLLLSRDDWMAIVDAAVREATINPGRLFGPAHNAPGRALAADVTGLVLKTVGQFARSGDTDGLIVNGEVLREATLVVLRHTSGAPDRVAKYRTILEMAIREATAVVKTNAGQFGGREWLALIRTLTAEVLAGKHDALLTAGPAATLIATAERANAVLKREAA